MIQESADTKRILVQLKVKPHDYEILKNYAGTLRIPVATMVRMVVLKQIQETIMEGHRKEVEHDQ